MKMKKLDLTGVKEFLFARGEVLALGLCTAVTLLLVAFTFMKGFKAGAPSGSDSWKEALKKGTQRLAMQVKAASEDTGDPGEAKVDPTIEKIGNDPKQRWLAQAPTFEPGSWISMAEPTDRKRRNPGILSVRKEPFQIDYVRAGVQTFAVDRSRESFDHLEAAGTTGSGPGAVPMPPPAVGSFDPRFGPGMAGGTTGGLVPVRVLEPRRLVVVSGVFPMREQIEEFRRALKFNYIQELVMRPDLMPRPVALNVQRYEVLADGKSGEAVSLYQFNEKTGKVQLAPALEDLLREAVLDETNPSLFHPSQLLKGLVTPLPQLANAKYPAIDLEGIRKLEVAVGGDPFNPTPGFPNPMGTPTLPPPMTGLPGTGLPGTGSFPGVGPGPMSTGPGTGVAGTAAGNIKTERTYRKLHPLLRARFEGKFEVFDPWGRPEIKADPKKDGTSFDPRFGPMTPMTPMGPEGPVGPMGPLSPDGSSPDAVSAAMQDALVRFVDVGVQPGKTYRYAVQVVLANPNYDKPDEVAYKELAKIKDMRSAWVTTPEIKVPGEYFYYAVDQDPHKDVQGGSDKGKIRSQDGQLVAPVQIHRWVKETFTQGIKHVVGDWAIAERLLVRKGEVLGRKNVMVQVPIWNKYTGMFEIGNISVAQAPKKGKGNEVVTGGLPVDFTTDFSRTPPPMAPVLVDFTGGRRDNVRFPGLSGVTEEAARSLLILSPDGKLEVHHQRVDTADRTRQNRVQSWLDRLRNLSPAGAPGTTPGGPGSTPGLPGLPGTGGT